MARLPESLPDDVWTVVCDFTRQPALSLVCRHLWTLLQKRHHKLHLRGDSLPRWVEWCQEQVRTAELTVRRAGAGGHTLATLRQCTALHTLNLDLSDNQVGAAGAEALATLKDSTALHTLNLNLSNNQVGDAGAKALATLKNSTALHTLNLCF